MPARSLIGAKQVNRLMGEPKEFCHGLKGPVAGTKRMVKAFVDYLVERGRHAVVPQSRYVTQRLHDDTLYGFFWVQDEDCSI